MKVNASDVEVYVGFGSEDWKWAGGLWQYSREGEVELPSAIQLRGKNGVVVEYTLRISLPSSLFPN